MDALTYTIDRDYVRQLFLELVQLDSPSLSEAAVASKCAKELETLGFQVTFDDAGTALGGNTGNLLAYLPGEPDCKTALLAAHMDTVQPGEGVRPRVDDAGVVWSGGDTVLGADDKAGLTAILAGLRALRQSGLRHGPIQVVFTIAEEMGLQGAKHLDASCLRADAGLSLDAGGSLGTIVVAGPAQAKWRAVFTGKAAHAGVAPERGISAIRVAAQAVSRMPHGRLDEATTVNVGSFVGQGPTNVVRDKVTLEGEARSLDEDALTRVLENIGQVFQETAAEHRASAEYEYTLMYHGFHFDEHHPVRKAVETAVRAAGFAPHPVKSGAAAMPTSSRAKGFPR
ncbi:hypothetical protein GCM10025857_38090 [Alicyclobacillus contaminans]|nr:hypothetical protein GCM10025857_38090 [Alicyclobacillus contaminans]